MALYVLCFVRAALIYLLIGVSLGLVMGMSSPGANLLYYLLPSHTHVNLIGWVSMLIFGVPYHVFPRFNGRPLHSTRLAWAHFFLANFGLVGMALFFFLNRWQEGRWGTPLAASMILQASGIVLFVYNVWRTTSPLKAEFKTS